MFSDNLRYSSFIKFDFAQADKESKIIIYGIGEIGKAVHKYLIENNYKNLLCFADRPAKTIGNYKGIRVIEPGDIPNEDYDYIFLTPLEYKKAIIPSPIQLGVDEKKILTDIDADFSYEEMYNFFVEVMDED